MARGRLSVRLELKAGAELACLHHMVEKDPTLAELADLPKGWYAERTEPGEPWERFESGPEEADD